MKAAHQPLRIEIGLSSPVMFTHMTPLDGNLCGMLFGQQEAPSIILDCLHYEDGVPFASLPQLANTEKYNVRLRPNLDLALSRQPELRISDAARREKITETSHFSYHAGTRGLTWFTPSITYYATGDADEIRRILDEAVAIGTGRTKGYGMIRRVRITEIDLDKAGIIDEDGRLARPVPLSWAAKLALTDGSYIRQMSRFSAPYRPAEVIERGQTLVHTAYPAWHRMAYG